MDRRLSKALKVTLDTNVLISATFWTGDSHRIIKLVEDKRLRLYLSHDILQEYRDVLTYPDLLEKIELKRLHVLKTIHTFEDMATIVHPTIDVDIIEEDPDDNTILACALEGGVDYIISQDNHLLKLGHFRKIPILTPTHFLELLNDK